jgi:hypothetical protein
MLPARRATTVIAAPTLLGIIFIGASAGDAAAERRSFGVAEDVDLVDAGGLEVRYASSHEREAVHGGLAELTYGISRTWDVAFGQAFGSTATSGVSMGDASLRVRWKPFERGDLPVDLRAELGVAKGARNCRFTAEPRIALGRNLWRLRVVANVGAAIDGTLGDATMDCGHGTDLDTAIAATWAGGVRFRLRPTVDVAAEAFGRIDDVAESERAIHTFVGPAVSWAPRPRFFATGSVGLGLGDDAKAVLARVMLGVAL